jgi:hypothetical protein
MGEARCGVDQVEFACIAGIYDKGGRVLTCSAETMLRLLRVSAWYAMRHWDDYETFRTRNPTPLGLSAFQASARGTADATFEQNLEALRSTMEASGANPPDDRVGRILQSMLNLEFAAIFGHEGSHLEEAPPYCAISEQSRAEESGLWSILMRVSASDELFKRASPVAAEVAADRCAMRRIRLERSVLAVGPLSTLDQTFVARAAADIISTLLLSHHNAPSGKPLFQISDAYMYPPLRMYALAGEMNAGSEGPTICGGAAENLVEATQDTFRLKPGNGILPDELEHLLPRGVSDAWNRRSTWSTQSYACR